MKSGSEIRKPRYTLSTQQAGKLQQEPKVFARIKAFYET